MSDEKWDKLADYDFGRIANALERIARSLEKALAPPAATGGQIFQIIGEQQMAIKGINVGGSGVFKVTWNGGMDPTKPVIFSSPDAGITFAAVATDPSGNTVTVSDAVLDANPSFDLTATGTASDGTAVTAVAKAVPLAQAPATGGTIDQLS